MRKRKGLSLKYLPHVIMFALGVAVAYGVTALIKVLELTEISLYGMQGTQICQLY
jgi:hypothetical protein